jgi:hypothetical protein
MSAIVRRRPDELAKQTVSHPLLATDPNGSLVLLARGPFGRVLLLVVVLCLAAYSIWGFVRAIFDPLHRGNDPRGSRSALGFCGVGSPTRVL